MLKINYYTSNWNIQAFAFKVKVGVTNDKILFLTLHLFNDSAHFNEVPCGLSSLYHKTATAWEYIMSDEIISLD